MVSQAERCVTVALVIIYYDMRFYPSAVLPGSTVYCPPCSPHKMMWCRYLTRAPNTSKNIFAKNFPPSLPPKTSVSSFAYFQPADHLIEKGWGREGPQPALQNIQEFKSPPCAVSPHLEAQPAESGDRGCWLKVERFPTSLPQRALLLLPLLLQLLLQLLLPLLIQLLLRTFSPDGAGCSAPAARGPKSSKPSRNCHHSSATKTTDDHHHCRHYFNVVLYTSSRLKNFLYCCLWALSWRNHN